MPVRMLPPSEQIELHSKTETSQCSCQVSLLVHQVVVLILPAAAWT